MGDYVNEKLREITIQKERKKDRAMAVNEGERGQLRRGVMRAMWMAREGRFDGLGSVSILSRKIGEATIGHPFEFNRLFKHFRDTKDLGLIYWPIHPADARQFVGGDAGTARK